MDSFIKEEVPSQEEEDVWDEPYRVLPESPYMDDVVDEENSENSVDSYDQFLGAEVCLLDEEWTKIMTILINSVKYNNGNSRGIEHSTSFADHSLYEVSFLNGQMEELEADLIYEDILS